MRPIVIVGLLAALAAGVYFGANALTAHLLATRLPAALTVDEGAPVAISNVRANVWRLRAYADEFVYGRPEAPYALIKDVTIELDGMDLLAGELQLSLAVGEEADWWPSRTPATRDGDDSETDLSAIEPWLPNVLEFGLLNVFDGDDAPVYAAQNVIWRRLPAAERIIEWQRYRGSDLVRYVARTPNVDEIVNRQGAELGVRLFATDSGEAVLAADVSSVQGPDGFDTSITLEGEGLQAVLSFRSPGLFDMPRRSELAVKNLAAEELTVFASAVDTTSQAIAEQEEAPKLLNAPLPVVDLPRHEMILDVAEMGIDDEMIRNVDARVQFYPAQDDKPARVEVPNIVAQLPRADIEGSLEVALGERWYASLDLALKTPSRAPENRGLFLSGHWLWQSGQLDVVTQGQNLAELIDNSRGQLDVSGVYRSHVELPVELSARFDERRGRLGAEQLKLTIGSSEIGGTVWIEEGQQGLYVRVHTPTFDVREFLPPPPPVGPEPPGVRLPDFSWWASELQVDARVTGDRVLLPRATITALDASLLRRPGGEQLRALFSTEGVGTFIAHGYTLHAGERRDLDLRVNMNEFEPRALGVDIPGKAQGMLRLQGGGTGFAELLTDLTGTLRLDVKFDATEDPLGVRASPRLLIADERIVGLHLPGFALVEGDAALARGEFRFDARGPEITGTIASERLDLDALLATLPATLERKEDPYAEEATAEEGETAAVAVAEAEATPLIVVEDLGAMETPFDVVAILENLPTVRFELTSDSLMLFEREVEGFGLEFESRAGAIDLQKLAFVGRLGVLDASASATVADGQVDLQFDGALGDLKLGTLFEEQVMTPLEAPLDGTIELATRGLDADDFLANLRGAIKLSEPAPPGSPENFEVDVDFRAEGRGIAADLNTLHYGASDLQGTVVFLPDPDRTIEVDLRSELLDIRGIDFFGQVQAELADLEAGQGETLEEASNLGERSLAIVEGILNVPFQLFQGRGDATGEAFFSDEPYPLELLEDVTLNGGLVVSELRATRGVMKGLKATTQIADSRFELAFEADAINGGPGNLFFALDAAGPVPTAVIRSELESFRPNNDSAMAPRSMFMDFEGVGDNEAALLSTMNGEVYLEGGQGRADFAELGLGFFTADLLGSVSRVLVPDANRVPMLECAVAYGKIDDGILTTPKGLIMQTRQANILMRAEINLKEETLAAQFDSRSRTGAGVSMGNVFSNTVRVRGPMTDPSLVPNTTGIIWRGWAALATGGLSLLGESFVKRMLSSDQACDRLRNQVRELVCEGPPAAASAPLVCPVNQPASA